MSNSDQSCNDSTSDPYQTDEDSDYLPSEVDEENNIQQELENVPLAYPNLTTRTQKGRKRVKHVNLWKRNIKKHKRITGQEYVNTSGQVVAEKRMSNDCCSCKGKCTDRVDLLTRESIFQSFYKLENKELQDSYLAGLIVAKKIKRRRRNSAAIEAGTGKEKSTSFTYTVRHGKTEFKVCKKAFVSIHSITKSRVERIANFMKGNATAPLDRRGKHNSRPNKIPDDINKQISEHIDSFPKYQSHYRKGHYYLAPHLSISQMHALYLEKYEPNQFELLKQNLPIKPLVKYDYYRKFFVENFKLSFGKPKTDTCQTCEQFGVKIPAADTEEIRKQLETEKQLHLLKANTFYQDIKEKTELAKSSAHIEVISIDYQQNFPLPSLSAGDVFYKRQLWVYNFCVHVASTNQSVCYLYDEVTAAKGQSVVVSLLQHFINNKLKPGVTDLYIFSDNCGSQNKNNVMVQFLYTLVKMSRFVTIIHRLPEPGHSFLPCDRTFGVIELKKRKYEKIYLPEEYANIINKAGKNFETVMVTQNMLLNYKDHFENRFKKSSTSKGEKFAISKYRLFKYTKATLPVIQCSITVGIPMYLDFVLEKPNQIATLPSNSDLLYSKKRELKPVKLEHVMYLANKYVPAVDKWYYNEIYEFHQDQGATASQDDGSVSDLDEEFADD